MPSPLPKFLMIGVPRSGSTALDAALRQHPDFFLAPGKETHFFSAGGDRSLDAMVKIKQPYRVTRDFAAYRDFFKDAAAFPQRGEIDPSILYRAAYAIPRIEKYLGSATRFIIVLRQPVERAYSHYRLHVREGHDPQSFASYADVTDPRTPYERIALDRYFGFSYYYESLRFFFEAFPREQFLVLLYDDLQQDSVKYMRTILEFLNADTRIIPVLTPELNAGSVPISMWGRLGSPRHGLRRFLRSFIPRSVRAAIRRRVHLDERAQGSLKKPALDPMLRSKLMVRYREDILRTQDLIGRDLMHWL